MSDEIEKRLRGARFELDPPSRETEERALHLALAELPVVRPQATPVSQTDGHRPRGRLGLLGRRPFALAAATGLTLIVAGVAVWAVLRPASTPSVIVAGGGGSDRFPSETFTDWVSYADQVSIVSVESEQEIPLSREDLVQVEQGAGYAGRLVTLRVEKTVWEREGAPSVEGTVRVITWGWAVREDAARRPVAPWDGPRLEVGGRYLVPLVRAPRDGVQWTPLSDGATLELDGDVITTARVAGNPSLIAKATSGKSVNEVSAILVETPPDPIAKKYWNLAPDERFKAVSREREGADK